MRTLRFPMYFEREEDVDLSAQLAGARLNWDEDHNLFLCFEPHHPVYRSPDEMQYRLTAEELAKEPVVVRSYFDVAEAIPPIVIESE